MQAVNFSADSLVAGSAAPSLTSEYTIWLALDPATIDSSTRNPFYISAVDDGVRIDLETNSSSQNVIQVVNSGQTPLGEMPVSTEPLVFGVRYSDTDGWEMRVITGTDDTTTSGTETGLTDPQGGDMGVGQHGNQGNANYDGLSGHNLVYSQRQSDTDWDDTAQALKDIWL